MRRIPRWGKVLIGIAGVLLVLALALPYLLDVDRYRPTILAAIEEQTGRKATMGKIRARLLPVIGFTIDDLAIASPAGFGDQPLVSIATIRGTLAWGPLLRRRLEVSGITLVKPKIQLIDGPAGHTNYEFPPAPAPARPSATQAPRGNASPDESSSSSFELADVDVIEIKDAAVVVGRVATANGPLAASFHASNVSLTLRNIALDAAKIKQWRVESDLKGVSLMLAGVRPIEVSAGTATLTNGALMAAFATTLGKAAEVKVSVVLDDVEKGTPKFDVTMPVLDLDQLGTVAAPAETTETSGAAAPTAKGARPPAASVNVIAEGRVSAERVRLAPIEGTAAHVDVRVYADRIEATPLSVDLYDGTLGATVGVAYQLTPATLDASIEIKRVNVAKMLAAMSVKRSITGTGALTLRLGGAFDGLPAALAGKGQASLRDGTIPGFGMDGLMGGLAKLTKAGSLAGGGTHASEIAYRSITGDLTIAASRIHSRQIHLDSSAGTVDISGSAGFDQALDYRGRASLFGAPSTQRTTQPGGFRRLFGAVAKQTIGRVPIPFTVRGTFGEPRISPG